MDNTFANAGVSAFLYQNYRAAGTDIAIQSDGKLVAAESALTRRHPDGSLDLTFGIGGIVDTTARNVALLADGKIVVIGYSGTGTIKSGPYSWATTISSIILRYLP